MSLEKHGRCLCGAVKTQRQPGESQRQRLPLQHVPAVGRRAVPVGALR